MSVRRGMSVLTVTYLLWNIGPMPKGVGAMRRSLTNSTPLGDMSMPTQLVGGYTSRRTTTEWVKHHVPLIGTGFDDALQER